MSRLRMQKINNEWLDNPNFVSRNQMRLLQEFKRVRAEVYNNHKLNDFEPRRL